MTSAPPDRGGPAAVFRPDPAASPTGHDGTGPARGPRPLHRPVPPSVAFPLAALGPLREAVEALRAMTQAPAALCAQSILATVTLAAQARADVELPNRTRRPLSAMFVTVAASGERKSTADGLALASVHQLEAERRRAYAAAVCRHERDCAARRGAGDAARQATRGKAGAKGAEAAARRGTLEAAAGEPRAPAKPALLVSDPTPDGLVVRLQEGCGVAGLFTSEGGLFLGGHAMNKENRMRTAALLNALWDGAPVDQERVGRGSVHLAGCRLTVHLMLQPGAAHHLLGDAMLEDLGCLARCLVVQPDSTIGHRAFREPTPEACAELEHFGARVAALLRRTLPAEGDDRPETRPALTLSPAAKAAWIAFHDAVEAELVEDGQFHAIRSFGAKMAEHAARLAGVLTVFEDADAREVSGPIMAGAILMVRHYAAEALRLQASAAVGQELALAGRVLRWWQARANPVCDLPTFYQRGPGPIRNAAAARRILAILEEHGHARRLPSKAPVDGASRAEVWELIASARGDQAA